MRFESSNKDENQWVELHSEKSTQMLTMQKTTMYGVLVSTLDGLSGWLEENKDIIAKLNEYVKLDSLSKDIKNEIEVTVRKIESETEVVKKTANFYLVLLDVNTYGYNCLLAKDEWEWRSHARHFFTILYEHRNSINPLLNQVVTALNQEFDLKAFIIAKKEFVNVIQSIADYAKSIRVHVDAHFDGEYEERIKIIENMSYYEVVELLLDYWKKTTVLMQEFGFIISRLQANVNESMLGIEDMMKKCVQANQ